MTPVEQPKHMGRIPPCPANPSEHDMQVWFEGMVARRLSFHPEDDPAEIIESDGANGYKKLFHPDEVLALRQIIHTFNENFPPDVVMDACCSATGLYTGDEP